MTNAGSKAIGLIMAIASGHRSSEILNQAMTRTTHRSSEENRQVFTEISLKRRGLSCSVPRQSHDRPIGIDEITAVQVCGCLDTDLSTIAHEAFQDVSDVLVWVGYDNRSSLQS